MSRLDTNGYSPPRPAGLFSLRACRDDAAEQLPLRTFIIIKRPFPKERFS
jgi:hypothetical protein